MKDIEAKLEKELLKTQQSSSRLGRGNSHCSSSTYADTASTHANSTFPAAATTITTTTTTVNGGSKNTFTSKIQNLHVFSYEKRQKELLAEIEAEERRIKEKLDKLEGKWAEAEQHAAATAAANALERVNLDFYDVCID